MSYTLADLQAGIQARGYGTDTAAAQTSLINTWGRKITLARRWRWREATAALSTVAGNSALDITSLASSLQDIDAVRLTTGGLTYWEPGKLRAHLETDATTRLPRHWTRYAGGVLLWPVPDAVYSVQIDYLKRWTPLVNPTDVPVLPEDYQDLLIYGPVVDLAHRERDWWQKQTAQADYAAAYAEMAEVDGRTPRQTSVRVVESGFFPSERLGDYWPFDV